MTNEEKAQRFIASLYPQHIRHIKALAKERFQYNISAAAQAIVSEHMTQHPEVNPADGTWTRRYGEE